MHIAVVCILREMMYLAYLHSVKYAYSRSMYNARIDVFRLSTQCKVYIEPQQPYSENLCIQPSYIVQSMHIAVVFYESKNQKNILSPTMRNPKLFSLATQCKVYIEPQQPYSENLCIQPSYIVYSMHIAVVCILRELMYLAQLHSVQYAYCRSIENSRIDVFSLSSQCKVCIQPQFAFNGRFLFGL